MRKTEKKGTDKMSKKVRLMFAYHDFLRGGKYFAARKILNLLSNKKISLGLDDDSWEVEQLAYELDLKVSYSRNYSGANVYL